MFFFFFKQKTAYELRISDWSSDVCSSDLSDVNYNLLAASIYKSNASLGMYGSISYAVYAGKFLNNKKLFYPDFRHFNGNQLPFVEIGRASCRERVCQYV